jgi:hypothetical protein
MSTASAATTAAITTIASAPATATEFRFGPRFIDDERPAAHVGSVEFLDGRLCILFGLHLNEREPARAARGVVAHDAHRLNGARLPEQILELVLPSAEWEIPNEQLPTHVHSPPMEPSLNGPSTLLAAKCEGIESENGSVAAQTAGQNVSG